MTENDLLKSGPDSRYNACLNFKDDMSYGYITGYREAADILVEYIFKYDSGHDTLIYPIALNYRHYLELLLKDIIKKGNKLFNISADLEKIHNLLKLWSIARELAVRAWPQGDTNYIKPIDDCIDQLNTIDPTGMVFRYSEDQFGNRHLRDIKHINVTKLSSIINDIGDRLDGVLSGFEEYYNRKCEMAAEAASYDY